MGSNADSKPGLLMRLIYTLVLPVAVIIAAGALAHSVYRRVGDLRRENHRRDQQATVERLAVNIDHDVMDHFAIGLAGLSRLPEIIGLLDDAGGDDCYRHHAIGALDTARAALGASFVYVMDRQGTVVASSTNGGQETLLGNNYAFRPYFQAALRGEVTVYPAVGVTTLQRGLYFACALRGAQTGDVLGVIVIKAALGAVDEMLANAASQVGVFSVDGVILAASRDDWLLRRARPIAEDRLQQLRASRQFGEASLERLDLVLDGERAIIDEREHLVARSSLRHLSGWEVVLLDEARPGYPLAAAQKNLICASAGVVGMLSGAVALLFALARRRRLTERILRQARQRLERCVGERTTELTLARDAAEAANRTKSRFLANLSHELRTPLNGIVGMTELALDTELTEQQRDDLLVVLRSAKALTRLIDDILDFSGMEAGTLEIEAKPFTVRQWLEETLIPLSIQAGRKGLVLHREVEITVPDRLVGDAMRLRQVLVNLVDNAIKFTERGRIDVRVSFEHIDGDEVSLQFAVRDTGIGIAPEQQREVFEAFRQADGSMTREYGGAGLGLAICSQIVGLMNGRIWVESQPGCGSLFCFTAVLGLPQPAYDREHAATNGSGGQDATRK